MCPPPIRGTEVDPHVPPRSASLLPSVLLQGAVVSLESPSWPFPFLLGFQAFPVTDAEGRAENFWTSLGRGPGAVLPEVWAACRPLSEAELLQVLSLS